MSHEKAPNIRLLREKAGLSQEYVAEKLGLSQTGYGKIETGVNRLHYNRIIQLAEILSTSVASFFPEFTQSEISEPPGNYTSRIATFEKVIERLNNTLEEKEAEIEALKEELDKLKHTS